MSEYKRKYNNKRKYIKKKKPKKILVGDFETTVYEGQTYTEVWASALVELNTEDVIIHHSIHDCFKYLESLDCDCIVYYHNLKFDGSFWLSYLIKDLEMPQATETFTDEEGINHTRFIKMGDMKNNTFSYSIAEKGLWYSVKIKTKAGNYIELRDSLKLIPFSVKEIGKSFETKHKKLDMEYEGYRFAGCEITEKEKQYIANDVLVVKEALEIMFSEGHTKLTIGSCCLSEFKQGFGREYDLNFPKLEQMELNKDIYGSETADEYIRKSYRGAWCYLVEGAENTVFKNGLTADVNSLYPSVMHSDSGNYYAVHNPHFWTGNYIPEEATKFENRYYFVRVKTCFYLKDGYLPFIQIKNSKYYSSKESLETSDFYNPLDNSYHRYMEDNEGNILDSRQEMTLTMTDLKLIQEHYDLVDFEILDGCWFYAEKKLFDGYINKYKEIKQNSKGAKRTLAKLYLNNLYGKLATNPKSNYKVALMKEDGVIGFYDEPDNSQKAGYIAIGSAITSYAREFTIRTAQKNFHGYGKRGFKYADTDSIHCDLTPEELIDVPIHESDFNHWKLESYWDKAIFVRQKTYIEHVTHEDGKAVEHPYHLVKGASIPKRCNELITLNLDMQDNKELYNKKEYNEQEREFLEHPLQLSDYKIGLRIPSCLKAKRIRGGVILYSSDFVIRG